MTYLITMTALFTFFPNYVPRASDKIQINQATQAKSKPRTKVDVRYDKQKEITTVPA